MQESEYRRALYLNMDSAERERRLKQMRDYYLRNSEKLKEYQRQYRKRVKLEKSTEGD